MKIIVRLVSVGIVLLLFASCSKSQSMEKSIAACKAGNRKSCISLAEYYSNDIDESTQYYLEACQLNAAEGCSRAGLNYLLKQPSDTEKALSLFSKSCSLDATKKGCYWLGLLTKNGVLIPKHYQNTMQYWNRACIAGEPESCQALGDLFREGMDGTAKDYYQATQAYQQACRKNYLTACISLIEIKMIEKSGKNGDSLYQEALKYESTLESRKKAYSLFLVACDRGQTQACMKLADFYEQGLNVPTNINKAYDFYLKSCDLGDNKGCTRAGVLIIQKGNSSDKNRTLATFLLDKSCRAKDEEACYLLRQLATKNLPARSTNTINENCDDNTMNCIESQKEKDVTDSDGSHNNKLNDPTGIHSENKQSTKPGEQDCDAGDTVNCVVKPPAGIEPPQLPEKNKSLPVVLPPATTEPSQPLEKTRSAPKKGNELGELLF